MNIHDNQLIAMENKQSFSLKMPTVVAKMLPDTVRKIIWPLLSSSQLLHLKPFSPKENVIFHAQTDSLKAYVTVVLLKNIYFGKIVGIFR